MKKALLAIAASLASLSANAGTITYNFNMDTTGLGVDDVNNPAGSLYAEWLYPSLTGTVVFEECPTVAFTICTLISANITAGPNQYTEANFSINTFGGPDDEFISFGLPGQPARNTDDFAIAFQPRFVFANLTRAGTNNLWSRVQFVQNDGANWARAGDVPAPASAALLGLGLLGFGLSRKKLNA
jgi:PEP-CTERM motif